MEVTTIFVRFAIFLASKLLKSYTCRKIDSTQDYAPPGYVCKRTCTVARRFLNLPDDLFPCQVGTGIAGRQETSSHLAHPPHRQDVHSSRYHHTTGIVFSLNKSHHSPSFVSRSECSRRFSLKPTKKIFN